jgi:hypothetical protein
VYWIVSIVVMPGVDQHEDSVFPGPCLRVLSPPTRRGKFCATHTSEVAMPISSK